jgi:tubulin epsilon
VFRFTASVFPSEDDDVVTSPYNAMLSLSKLVEFADCVLPIENQALAEIVGRVDGRTGAAAGGGGAVPAAGVLPEPGRGEPGRAEEGAVVLDSREPSVYQAIDLVALGGADVLLNRHLRRLIPVLCFPAAKPFDSMNGIAASMLLNMTSSVRFEGSLNVDLNDITMNLVPFPQVRH